MAEVLRTINEEEIMKRIKKGKDVRRAEKQARRDRKRRQEHRDWVREGQQPFTLGEQLSEAQRQILGGEPC